MPVIDVIGEDEFSGEGLPARVMRGNLGPDTKDDDAALRLVDSSGVPILTTNTNPEDVSVDPFTGQAAPVGTDVGFSAPVRRWFESRVLNGDFSALPSDPDRPIDSRNPLPYWRWVVSQGTNITATIDTSGDSNLIEWRMETGSSGDFAYLEQLVPVRATPGKTATYLPWAYWDTQSGSASGSAEIVMTAQYLKADATTTTGTEGEESPTLTTVLIDAGGVYQTVAIPDTTGEAPADAAYLRIRVGVRGSVANSMKLLEVGVETGTQVVLLTTSANFQASGWGTAPPKGALLADTSDHLFYALGGTSRRLLSSQLVPIHFVAVNVPANTTTIMEFSDNAAGNGNGRMEMPWSGSIVGVSYRTSVSLSAGQMTIQPTVASSSVVDSFTLTSASGLADSTKYGIGTYTFNATQNVGIQLVTNASYAPTTLDVVCILWVALDYDGDVTFGL